MKKHFQFALKDISLPNILFRLNPLFKPKDGEVEINTTIEVDYSHKGTSLSVHVRVDVPDGENAPFAFAVEGIGSFELGEKPPEDVLEGIARVNCAAMVFPYIREAIADLTRRAGVPSLHLQPVNFVALMNAEKAAEKRPTVPKRVASKKK